MTTGDPRSAVTASANWEAFVQGLRESGYVEGQNIACEHRYTHGRPELFPDPRSNYPAIAPSAGGPDHRVIKFPVSFLAPDRRDDTA